MSNLIEGIKNWVSEHGDVDLIIISKNRELVEKIIEELTLTFNGRFVLPVVYPNKDIFKSTQDPNKNSDRIITTRDFGSSRKECIFFGDFVNSHYLTDESFDYFAVVDREPIYRKYCKSVAMYNFAGTPPMNAYWVFDSDKSFENDKDSIYILKRSEWANICVSCPFKMETDSRNITIENVDLSVAWVESLKNLLTHFVTAILGTNEYNEQIFSTQNMVCWVRGFIHETFNNIYSYNGLEFIGDAIFEGKMATYMYAKFPLLTAGEATNYSTEYVSKDYMSIWSQDMGLCDFLLADPVLFSAETFASNKKIKGDLFESFFAALYNTCSSIDPYLGELACTNVTTLIGNTLSFEKKIAFGRAQHRVEQILASLGYKGKYKVRVITPGKNSEDDDEDYDGPIQGDINVKNRIQFVSNGQEFISFVNRVAQSNQLFADILKPYEYSPFQITDRKKAVSNFWERISTIFQKCGIDLEYAKMQKNIQGDYFDEVARFDPDLIKRAREKLKLIMKNTDDKLSNYVQFKFNRDDGYIVMYIHTDKLVPNSGLLNSIVTYYGGTHSAPEDYYSHKEQFFQIENLAVVPFPLVRETVMPGVDLIPTKLGIYNAIKKFTN